MFPVAHYLALIDRRWRVGGSLAAAGERHDEFADVLSLLRAGIDRSTASASAADAAALDELAACVARACLGDDHLWHDLGLPSRAELSALLHEHFPLLAGRNVGNMRWKKFFYKQLCEQEGINACRAPSCGVCVGQRECFGTEELPLRQMAA